MEKNNPLLRSCENKLRKDNKSGIAGVRWNPTYQRWIVEIGNRTLGYRADFFDACCLRKSAEIKRIKEALHDKKRNEETQSANA